MWISANVRLSLSRYDVSSVPNPKQVIESTQWQKNNAHVIILHHSYLTAYKTHNSSLIWFLLYPSTNVSNNSTFPYTKALICILNAKIKPDVLQSKEREPSICLSIKVKYAVRGESSLLSVGKKSHQTQQEPWNIVMLRTSWFIGELMFMQMLKVMDTGSLRSHLIYNASDGVHVWRRQPRILLIFLFVWKLVL